MKTNLFDLFANYDGELPEITEEHCNTDRIEQLVMQKTGMSRIRQTKKSDVHPVQDLFSRSRILSQFRWKT